MKVEAWVLLLPQKLHRLIISNHLLEVHSNYVNQYIQKRKLVEMIHVFVVVVKNIKNVVAKEVIKLISWKGNEMKFDTKVIRSGIQPDPTTGAIVPPIYQGCNFSHPHRRHFRNRQAQPRLCGTCGFTSSRLGPGHDLAVARHWRHIPAGGHSAATFWYVLPSLPMFLLIPWLLGRGIPFYGALILGAAITIVLYFTMILILPRLGLELSN